MSRKLPPLAIDRVHPFLPDGFDGAPPAHVIVADMVHTGQRLNAAVQARLTRVGSPVSDDVAERGAKHEEDAPSKEEGESGAHEIDEVSHIARSLLQMKRETVAVPD